MHVIIVFLLLSLIVLITQYCVWMPVFPHRLSYSKTKTVLFIFALLEHVILSY